MQLPRYRAEITVPARTILLLAGVFFLGWAIVSVRDALLLVFTGVFLGLVFEFPTRALQRRTGMPRGLAATVVVLGAVVVLTALALVLLVPLVETLRDYLRELPELVSRLRESDELGWLGDSGAAGHAQEGADQIASGIPTAASAVLGVAGEAAGVALAAFTLTFVTLFFLTDVERLKAAVGSVLHPEQGERWLGIWERVTEMVSRWAIGVVMIAIIAGAVQGLTAFLLGSSFALALAVIAGALDTIPNIGATIAGFVLSLTLLAEEGLTAALIMLAVVLVYQQVENSIVAPTVQGRATNISGFFVISGVTVFGALLGVLGALIAVPVTATIQILVQEITRTRRAEIAAEQAATVRHASPY
jgi:predicted PurR-regulated permease PerM